MGIAFSPEKQTLDDQGTTMRRPCETALRSNKSE
jgi:hypothetical protein